MTLDVEHNMHIAMDFRCCRIWGEFTLCICREPAIKPLVTFPPTLQKTSALLLPAMLPYALSKPPSMPVLNALEKRNCPKRRLIFSL